MKNLNTKDIELVVGATEGESSNEATVYNMAEIANNTCGHGNVKSVTTDGFECFEPSNGG